MALEKVGEKALIAAHSTNEKSQEIKRPTKRVLDEDTYTEDIEKIIVKDFYPDLPRLQAQAEYFDALERNDTEKLREIHIKYGPKRGGSQTPSIYSTPATFETPSENTPKVGTNPTPREPPDKKDVVDESAAPPSQEAPTHNPEPTEARTKYLEKLNLDKYFSKNTSEDNASFEEILQEGEKKHRAKHAWLFQQEEERDEEKKESLALPSCEEQQMKALMPPPTAELKTWTYQTKNSLMYIPEGTEYTSKEKIENVKAEPREIVHGNTRFKAKPFNVHANKEQLAKAASAQAQQLQGKIGPDGKEVLPEQTPSVNGYKFVGTPSPMPGVEDSPMMTWGEIEGTPFHLDGSDTPVVTPHTPGPSFKIADIPRRDQIAHRLAEDASKAHRMKKQEALKRVQATFSTTTPKFGSHRTDRLSNMSPAAQRLATSKLGIRTNTDKALKASYTPTPSHRLPGDSTPIARRTPGSTPKSDPKTPQTGVTPKRDSESLTDNLLNLPKRPKAQDFFS